MSSSLELVGILCPKFKKDIHSFCLHNPKLKMFIWPCFNHCLRFLFDSPLKKYVIHTRIWHWESRLCMGVEWRCWSRDVWYMLRLNWSLHSWCFWFYTPPAAQTQHGFTWNWNRPMRDQSRSWYVGPGPRSRDEQGQGPGLPQLTPTALET